MPDNTEVKFTDKELETIKSFQQKYLDVQMGFGQAEMSRNRLDDQYENLETAMENLRKTLSEIQLEEKTFIDSINKKYGDGVLNPETGVFTPSAINSDTQ